MIGKKTWKYCFDLYESLQTWQYYSIQVAFMWIGQKLALHDPYVYLRAKITSISRSGSSSERSLIF